MRYLNEMHQKVLKENVKLYIHMLMCGFFRD